MREVQAAVEEFHRATLVPARVTPGLEDETLRATFILEEAAETVCAMLGASRDDAKALGKAWLADVNVAAIERPSPPDLPEAVDGLADTIFVCLGAAARWGVDLEPIWDAVCRANMAKVGGPVRADGKRLKPPGWTPPDIAGELEKQGWRR